MKASELATISDTSVERVLKILRAERAEEIKEYKKQYKKASKVYDENEANAKKLAKNREIKRIKDKTDENGNIDALLHPNFSKASAYRQPDAVVPRLRPDDIRDLIHEMSEKSGRGLTGGKKKKAPSAWNKHVAKVAEETGLSGSKLFKKASASY